MSPLITGYIDADWPAPRHVHAVTTLRAGGVSKSPYDSFNLAGHVGDDAEDVRRNRERLIDLLKLPAEPRWLTQVHGTNVVDAVAATSSTQADGSATQVRGVVCAVLTADCLPIFLCDEAGSRVGILHAGWRGLAAGIVEAGLRFLDVDPTQLYVWLGPGIGADAYEVGDDVRNTFVQQHSSAADAFRPAAPGKWWADMYTLARQRLMAAGVTRIFGGDYCTFRDATRFYSYRRDGRCGRMASLIWMTRAG